MSDINMPWWWNVSPSQLYLDEADGAPAIKDQTAPALWDKFTPAEVLARRGAPPPDHCPTCWIVNQWRSESSKCPHAGLPHFVVWYRVTVKASFTGKPHQIYRIYGCRKAIRADPDHDGDCWVETIQAMPWGWRPVGEGLQFEDERHWKRYQARNLIVPTEVLQMAGKVIA